jgi:hypothetical protein
MNIRTCATEGTMTPCIQRGKLHALDEPLEYPYVLSRLQPTTQSGNMELSTFLDLYDRDMTQLHHSSYAIHCLLLPGLHLTP